MLQLGQRSDGKSRQATQDNGDQRQENGHSLQRCRHVFLQPTRTMRGASKHDELSSKMV